MDPPGRGSLWRFKDSNPLVIPYADIVIPNYSDHEANCGGLSYQISQQGKVRTSKFLNLNFKKHSSAVYAEIPMVHRNQETMKMAENGVKESQLPNTKLVKQSVLLL